MFGIGIIILALMVVYGVRGMAALAIFIDKLKYGDKGVEISDTLPPTPPVIWTDYAATKSAEIVIYALSEPGTKVFLFLDSSQVAEKGADKEGEVVFSDIVLKSGKNQLWTKAQDESGNMSNQSKVLEIIFMDKGPELNLEKPSEGQRFSGNDNPIEIRGKTGISAKVYINNRLTIADGNGGFVLKYNLNEGENILKIKVVDTAGNEGFKEVKVFYQP